MTVTSTTAKVEGLGNGVATDFSFSFTIFASTDLEVTLVESSGAETLLTEGTGATNYSVAPTSTFPGNGTVTYPADEVTPMPTGDKIVIKRVLPLTQLVDLENQGPYLPDVQEQVFDRLLMIALQQQEEIDRSIKTTIGDADVDLGELLNNITTSETNAAASATNAATSATNAATSETNAAASASAASTSETNAAASASAASTSETNAATSASNASTSATNAATSETNAATSASDAAASATDASNFALLNSTSTSSVAVGSGSKTFVTVDARAYQVGQFILVARTSAPTTTWMWGQVTSWTSGTKTLILNITEFQGTGTHTDWTIGGTGAQGIPGTISSIVTETADFTLALSHEGQYVRCNKATAQSVTVPPNSSVAFSVGTQVHLRQIGAGQVTIVEGAGVTVNVAASVSLSLKEQHSTVTLVKVATDEWDAVGDMEAV